MRLSLAAMVVVLACLTIGVGAQTVGVSDWTMQHPERRPTSSWHGSTGMIIVPTAFVGKPLRVSGGYHRVDTDLGDYEVYNANVAITADLEFGAARLKDVWVADPLGAFLTSETVMNAKYNLDFTRWFKVLGAPEIAVGVWDAADELNRVMYVVASKRFSISEEGTLSQFTAHVGFGDTERNVGALDGLFGGIEFVPFRDALVQIEYDAEDVNAALRYFPAPQIALDVGLLDGNLGWGITLQASR